MIGVPESVYRDVMGNPRARTALAHLRTHGPEPYSKLREALRKGLEIQDEQFERLIHLLEEEALVGRRAAQPTEEEKKNHRYRVILELTGLGKFVADLVPRLDELAGQMARDYHVDPVGWQKA